MLNCSNNYELFQNTFSPSITLWIIALHLLINDNTNRHFWCRGYYVDTVGRNKKAIQEYIRNQLQEDIANDQISLKEYIDQFTGSKNT